MATRGRAFISSTGDVVYFSTRTGKYLEAGLGAPSRNLLSMARSGLRFELRSILRDVAQRNSVCIRDNIAVETDDSSAQILTLIAEPINVADEQDRLFLILFLGNGPIVSRDNAIGRLRLNNDETLALLEREIRETNDRLQATIEEYETALEEVKSSNEEMLSVNEEFQSANEELEASKEEFQSLNEELQTVNSELTIEIDALDKANSDLTNLFESTQIATIFIDRNFIIQSFTPISSKLFNIIKSDVGRPLTDLSACVNYPGLTENVKTVLASGEIVEHRIESHHGQNDYLARIRPYKSANGSITGAVLTFVDITVLTKANVNIIDLRETDAHLRVIVSELNHRVKNMLSGTLAIVKHTLAGTATPKDAYEAVVGRLHGLGASYEL